MLAATEATFAELERIRLTDDIAEKRTMFDDLGAASGVPDTVSTEAVLIDALAAEWIRGPSKNDHVILYLHGGGFFTGSIRGFRPVAARMALASQATLLLPEYRLAPEHLFPAALDDALAAYRYLLEVTKVAPTKIAIVGDSAGATLAMQLVLQAKAGKLPLPGCVVCLSPFADFRAEGASVALKAAVDPMIGRDGILGLSHFYFQGSDLDSAPATILGADLTDLPPLLVLAGSHETLLDDAVRLATRAAHHDVRTVLDVAAGMPHVYPFFFPSLPESERAISLIGEFVRANTAS